MGCDPMRLLRLLERPKHQKRCHQLKLDARQMESRMRRQKVVQMCLVLWAVLQQSQIDNERLLDRQDG